MELKEDLGVKSKSTELKRKLGLGTVIAPVSYTHLTLPTNSLV